MRNARIDGSWRTLSRVVGRLTLFCITAGAAQIAQAQANNAPDSFSNIMGIGLPRSTGYAGPSGSAIEALPIELAQGRKSFQPNLTLLYSSSGGGGEVGLGWGLEVGQIQRSPSHGIPTGSQIDEFIFSLAGSADVLVPIGGGAYRPRLESVFRQYNFIGDHWEVRDGAGTRYTFGANASNRIDGILWMLERVEDTNGNTVTVGYMQDGGYFYPAEIKYTGHAPSNDAGSNRVVFEYEDRTDRTISFALGSEQRRGKRLHRISNFAGPQLVRRYEVQYTESGSSHRSLVDAVSLIGTDDTARVDSRRYQYQVGAFGFDASTLGTAFPVNFRTDTGGDTGARSATSTATAGSTSSTTEAASGWETARATSPSTAAGRPALPPRAWPSSTATTWTRGRGSWMSTAICVRTSSSRRHRRPHPPARTAQHRLRVGWDVGSQPGLPGQPGGAPRAGDDAASISGRWGMPRRRGRRRRRRLRLHRAGAVHGPILAGAGQR